MPLKNARYFTYFQKLVIQESSTKRTHLNTLPKIFDLVTFLGGENDHTYNGNWQSMQTMAHVAGGEEKAMLLL